MLHQRVHVGSTTAAAILAIALSASCAPRPIASTSPFPRPASRQLADPIEVAVADHDESLGTVTYRLTNASGRPIVAWHLAVLENADPKYDFWEDLFDSDRRLAVDGHTTVTFSRTATTPHFEGSAVFEDRSSAGSERGVQQIFERRTKMRDALSAWVAEMRTDLAGGAPGMARMRSRVEQRARARNSHEGTLSLDIDAAQVFASGAEITGRLAQLVARGQRKLSLAGIAATREP